MLPTHPTIPLTTTSNFSTSVPAFKKTQKPAKGDHHTSTSTSDTPASVDTFDPDEHFAALETELAKIIEKLKDDLSKLRTSRVDPNQFEGVTVIMDKVANETVLLKDIAHVVVKGRNLSVGVYEAAVCFPASYLLYRGGTDREGRMLKGFLLPFRKLNSI